MNPGGYLLFVIRHMRSALLGGLVCGTLLLEAVAGFAQVNPAEILNPQLKAAEQAYFPQLIALNRAIAATKFPFSFALGRYVGLDPQKQTEMDSRGVEFVRFHEQVVLKITGNYNAAYDADLLTQNQRASRTFRDVVIPLLQHVTKIIPADVNCDAVGFEISHHVRRKARTSDFEGKEILVVVFERADAFGLEKSVSVNDQQEILNRSEVYLNGQEYGLALGEKDPLNLEALGRSASPQPAPASSAAGTRLSRITSDVSPGLRKLGAQTGAASAPGSNLPSGTERPDAAPAPAATPADAERLQAKFQSQLDALAKEGVAKFQFVDYAPPSFVIVRDQVVLQVTIRNPLRFEKDSSSIYKRAAQSFDLFLAPQLKALLEKLPAGAELSGLDVTLVNQLSGQPKPSSEALEFIFPLKPLRRFTDAEITNQDLINQSIVLVNGVRIALNLQLVE